MGIKQAEIKSEGKDILITGENEVGKTRFATGWNWLLFDKDIYDKSNFDIKWLDENNNVKDPGLEYVVEGNLLVDGNEMTLKKVYYEQWQKKKGSTEERFTGHTTDYFINDVPKKKKEYDQEISDIIDEETFRLLTDPDYFCGKLHWEKRREFLMDTFGTLTDREIIEINDNLNGLLEVIEKRGIDEHKAMCKSKKKKINEQIKKLPTRIDEVNNNLPDVAGMDWKEIELDIADLKDKKQKKEQELARAENGGEVAEKKKKITEIETKLQEIRNEHTAEYEEKMQNKKQKLSELRDQLEDVERESKKRQQKIKDNKKQIEKLEKEKEQLKQHWYNKQKNKKRLTEQSWEGDKNCPTCGQDLPKNQIEEAKAKFNREKAGRIEQLTEGQAEINQQGKNIVEKIDKLNEENKQLQNEIDQQSHDVSFKEDEKDKIVADIIDLREKDGEYEESKKYHEKLKEKVRLEDEIKQLKGNNMFSLQKIDKEITSISEKIEEEQEKLSNIRAYNKGQKRIEELKAKEKKLAKEYEKHERQINLCEQFTKAKVNALEGEINSHFEYTDWKLFEKLVNGGIDETCEALHKGVAYNSTLNTGAKILVGVDVINTLSEHYGIRVPVFVDNYESLSKELESECQIIKLKMVEGVEELRIEKEGA